MKHKCTAQFNEGRKGLEGKHINRILFSWGLRKRKTIHWIPQKKHKYSTNTYLPLPWQKRKKKLLRKHLVTVIKIVSVYFKVFKRAFEKPNKCFLATSRGFVQWMLVGCFTTNRYLMFGQQWMRKTKSLILQNVWSQCWFFFIFTSM